MKLSKRNSQIVIGLYRTVNEMDRQTRQICKEHDITFGQFAVLEALLNKGELTIGEIKESVLSTDGTIPVVIGNLEKRDLVQRRQDEQDKRKFIVSLTEAGREVIEQVAPENAAMLTEMFGVLSEEEKSSLVGIISKLRK